MFRTRQKRVNITKDIDLQPWTTLKRGEAGTVVNVERDAGGIVSADIVMDKKHDGLRRWGNEAHIAGPELAALEFTGLQRPRAVTICLSTIVAYVTGAILSGAALAEGMEAVTEGWGLYYSHFVDFEMALRALFTG